MSEAENPERLVPDREVSVEDVRALMGPATPHFALQLRNRIAKLIRGLPADHAARIEGEREIDRLDRLSVAGERRGQGEDADLAPLPSLRGE